MKKFLQKCWPYLVAIVVFATVACIYMSPALDGNVIAGSDNLHFKGAVQETLQYTEETGEHTFWTGSMFSGMPNYQIGGGYYVADQWMRPILRTLLWGTRDVIAIVMIFLLSFFALLRSFKVNKWLSVVGALAMAFSSYFFIIIGANHHTKTASIALMSVVVGGFYLIYHGHRKLGVVLTMICTAAGLYPHPQMAYYMCFMIGCFFVAELWLHIRHRAMKQFGVSTLIFAFAFIVGIGTGTSKTFVNTEYAKETMRGGHSDLAKTDDAVNKTEGLDLDYATAWSYGIDEVWTFLIPNYMGGSSHYSVGEDSELCQTMIKKGIPRRSSEQFCESVPTYWGTQPFTAGPVYMGAVVCFLFVLGLLIVKGPYKWAILAVTLLSVFLSWGHNWMWLTRFFFEVVPMYNKFRAVSSILVVAEVAIPLLGFLALKQLTDGTVSRREVLRSIGIAGGVTGGMCLVMALFASAFCSFTSPNDAQIFSQLPEWMGAAIIAERQSMLTSDAWRSLLFILLAVCVLWWFVTKGKQHVALFSVLLGVLILADMWPVNKRFMNDKMFSKPNTYQQYFAQKPYEKQILQDQDPHFRVLNLSVNTFNDARTSYYLKSIGGYHAAKLRRYQDLIDRHISKMHWPVINMLNGKYIIVQNEQGQVVPQLNRDAMGNAWFVDSLVVVEDANAECDALTTYDLNRVAVLDRSFASHVEGLKPAHDSLASVRLTKYTPEYIEYESTASRPGTIVFSEIYYPHGWNALIDGQPTEHYRVNYLLRALNVPAGQHHIRFEFRPESITKGNIVSMTFVIIMYLTIAFCLVSAFIRWRRQSA